MKLEGRGVLVTGGARRIGRAFCERLAREGMHVAVHYNQSNDDAQAVVDGIVAGSNDVRAAMVQGDLSDPERAGTIIDAAESSIGPVHAVVNNASIFFPESFEKTTYESLRKHQAVHSDAPFMIAKRFSERLPDGETGAIVNLLDWRATRPDAKYFGYGLSKASLYFQTLLLAQALAPRVRVNAIAPGAILPPEFGDREANQQKHDAIGGSTPAARSGSTGELDDALVYLLRDATYTTGMVIPVDGGRHLQ